MVATIHEGAFSNGLRRIGEHSPFLAGLAERNPDTVAAVRDKGLADAIRDGLEAAACDDVAIMLRRQRQVVSLAVGIADICGMASLEEVVGHLSAFADHALHLAIRAAIIERTPDAEPRGFAALALGKHGSRELNYSSDIDPILIFDPSALPHRPREEPVEAAVRIARRVVELLQTRDEHGYVFRVDLRLRPSPEISPLALPIDAALSYYESAALPWERAAFIRARAAAGDIALGQHFLDSIRPFIWRRSIDFGAVQEIRQISSRIRDHYAQGQQLGPGYDLKRGRGGIREIEFYTQIHQLIHGGREPQLRAPATLDALRALGDAGRIADTAAADLTEAYRLYRTIEHRLQMVDDHQTHRLPREADALDNVARLHGLEGGASLIALLRPHIDRVGTLYDGLDTGEERLPQRADKLEMLLAGAGFADPGAARQRIEAMREGKSRALRTPVAQAALEAMLPTLVAALGKAPLPQDALNRFEDLVAGLPSAINLFRLLQARPSLARALIDVLSHAPTLSQALGRRPALLDGLIDSTALAAPPPFETLVEEFRAGESKDSYEQLLDGVRQRVGERRFALGVQLIEAVSDPIDVAQGYARVAEAALTVLADATIAEFEEAHGKVPGGELLVVALGRLGGGALTHASDLDIVYLFTGNDFMAESDGRRPLGTTTYFNRLAQRVSAALSVATASGPLYEVDTRLRPSGTQGPLAVSVDSFAQYQRESAWTWEHMALTRARTIFGSTPARAQVDAMIAEVLGRSRTDAVLTAEVVKMRGDIARHKPPSSPFDVKLIDGGLVDAEFAVHLLQLRHGAGFDPRLRTAMRLLSEEKLIDPAIIQAHELLTRMLVTLRLVSPASSEPPEASKPLVARTCGQADWPSLVKAYESARELIRGEWKRISGQP